MFFDVWGLALGVGVLYCSLLGLFFGWVWFGFCFGVGLYCFVGWFVGGLWCGWVLPVVVCLGFVLGFGVFVVECWLRVWVFGVVLFCLDMGGFLFITNFVVGLVGGFGFSCLDWLGWRF